MKCPKCGYIGFEPADRCRNCGYDFALVETRPGDADLPLHQAEAPAAPLGDFDLGEAARPRRESPRRRPQHEETRQAVADPRVTPAIPVLPLFDEDELPIVPAAAPTPPLAVRHSAPPASRARTRVTPRTIEPQPGAALPLSSEDVEAAPTPMAVPPAGAADGATCGPGRRALAGLIDLLLLAGSDAVVIYFTLKICRLAPGDMLVLPLAPMAAFLLLFNGGYLALPTAAGGQTPGKMAMRLKVVRVDERRLTVARAILRTCALLLCVLPAGLGLLPVLFGGHRGAHDHLAGTRVVRADVS
jgi:uncharacterized RDD family membrane protein YckC